MTKQPPTSEAQDYIDNMVTERGYVLDYHKKLAFNDFATMQSVNNLVDHVYLSSRSLDRATKELLFVLSLTVMRAPEAQIISHIKVALSLGVSAQQILEAIEISLPEAGIVAFQGGFEAWCKATGAEGLEPSVTVQG